MNYRIFYRVHLERGLRPGWARKYNRQKIAEYKARRIIRYLLAMGRRTI